ncbi:hypothetical protein LCGC14_1966910 [marine sediment metagenome]|uniref:GATA-type domain-containing protein n=1 Tax=marine sediment metagenome TaxID=412755 RepID=A0A0F9FCV0_9ZZZZ
MTKDEHCKHALTLSSDEKWEYQEKHGITSADVWRCGQKQKSKCPTRAKKKKTRTRVLASQGGCCALCGRSDTGQWCLDRSGRTVCNGCNNLLTKLRKLWANGVTCEDMEEFIE